MAEDSCTLVIFGASGDLAKRKLVPALWSMFQGRVLPEPFAVIGVARSEMTNEQFRARMREAIAEFARVQPPTQRVWDRFAQALFYYTGDPANLQVMPWKIGHDARLLRFIEPQTYGRQIAAVELPNERACYAASQKHLRASHDPCRL